jgi:transcriptional antiterminator NusG
MTDESVTPEAQPVPAAPEPPPAPSGTTAVAEPPAEGTPAPEPETPAEHAESAPAPAETAQASAVDETPGETPPPPPAPPVAEEVPPPPPPPPSNKRWYVVKVQSGREESIKEAIERRVKIENLEEFFGQIIIPVERVIENRNGKRVTKERKLYPGYLMVEVEYNDRILYLFRETSGVGDFVGGSMHHAPPPMSEREVERMLGKQGEKVNEKPAKPKFDRGDRVKVKDGTFAGMEGEVKDILEAKGLVRVELTIFGRPVPVELEYWQVEHS